MCVFVCVCVCVCVCVFKIIRYAWQTWGRVVEMHVCNVCVSGGAAVCFPYFFGEEKDSEANVNNHRVDLRSY